MANFKVEIKRVVLLKILWFLLKPLSYLLSLVAVVTVFCFIFSGFGFGFFAVSAIDKGFHTNTLISGLIGWALSLVSAILGMFFIVFTMSFDEKLRYDD